MSKILILEDDERLSKPLVEYLESQLYIVNAAYDGEIAWKMASENLYDLIVLDWMLPRMDGLSLCIKLRDSGYIGSILMLTARDTEKEIIKGLDCGADDYLIKPLQLGEFLARVRAMLRRGTDNKRSILKFGDLQVDPGACSVTYNNQSVSVTPTEYRLLSLFMRNPNRAFSRDELLERLWTDPNRDSSDLVKAHIKGLRNNLKAAGVATEVIKTVHGQGYRLGKLDG